MDRGSSFMLKTSIFKFSFFFSPSLPASWSCILSISIGVVIITWHMPAPQPAIISLNTVKPLLWTDRRNIAHHSWGDFCGDLSKPIYFPVNVNVAYPSLASLCLKKSFAANLIAFSGVTRVKLTAAPDDKKWTKLEQKSQSDLNTHCHQLMTIITLEYIISSQ